MDRSGLSEKLSWKLANPNQAFLGKLRYHDVNRIDDIQQQIAELEALIADLDRQSGDLIRLRAGLAPVKDFAMRQTPELNIQTMIADVAGLRARLNELTERQAGSLPESGR